MSHFSDFNRYLYKQISKTPSENIPKDVSCLSKTCRASLFFFCERPFQQMYSKLTSPNLAKYGLILGLLFGPGWPVSSRTPQNEICYSILLLEQLKSYLGLRFSTLCLHGLCLHKSMRASAILSAVNSVS